MAWDLVDRDCEPEYEAVIILSRRMGVVHSVSLCSLFPLWPFPERSPTTGLEAEAARRRDRDCRRFSSIDDTGCPESVQIPQPVTLDTAYVLDFLDSVINRDEDPYQIFEYCIFEDWKSWLNGLPEREGGIIARLCTAFTP